MAKQTTSQCPVYYANRTLDIALSSTHSLTHSLSLSLSRSPSLSFSDGHPPSPPPFSSDDPQCPAETLFFSNGVTHTALVNMNVGRAGSSRFFFFFFLLCLPCDPFPFLPRTCIGMYLLDSPLGRYLQPAVITL